MDFRILGPLEVCADRRALPLGGAKQRALLALLLLHRNEVVSVDRAIDSLWGEAPPPAAAKTVQVYVSRLRRLLGQRGAAGSRLVTRPPGYLLEVAPEEVDLDRFELLVDEARRAGASGEQATAAAALRQALALWRGPPLSDVALAPFAQEAARGLEEQRLEALEARVEADLALGRAPELVGELSALVREHPYRERLRASLMLALYRSGRQAEALEAYRAARRALVDELGIDPSPALTQLERAILSHDPTVALPTAQPGPRVESETGAFFDFQDATGSPQVARLPSDRTSFVIGRSPEVELVLDWDERVSRVHARLEPEGEGWMIVDDGPSRNGTFVNGERVVDPRRLQDQDLVHVGRTALTFRSPRSPGVGSTIDVSHAGLQVELTLVQWRVLRALCQPSGRAGRGEGPATADEIATELLLQVDVVQGHLRELARAFGITAPTEHEQRSLLARVAIDAGLGAGA
jgi:DNA-binding SARP family transcriptional activator/pSer/pThr/pTyr-binding forkhead associated (FHA) protein